MYARLVFALLLLAVPAGAARDFSVISIDAAKPGQVQRIADMGIDIWDVAGTKVKAAVRPDQIAMLQNEGFTWTVVFADRNALESSIPKAAGPEAITYRSFDQVVSELQRIANTYPSICKLYTLGTTYENRTIYALKISERVNLDRTVPRVFFSGAHHAREWISVEVPLRLADYLASSCATDAQVRKRLNQTEIWIAPVLNADGYVYSWTTDRYWRKNRKPVGSGYYGVDLNRNYGYQWGGGGASPYPYDETYRGPSAFSENETQAIRDFMLSRQFYSAMNYHSYSQLVLWPWGYTYSPAPDASPFSTLGTDMTNLIKAVHSKTYTPQQASALYIASGDSDDWMYGVEGVYAYTTELRPTSGSGYGFALPADQIVPTFEENLPAAMRLLDWTDTRVPTVGIEVWTNLTTASFSITGPASYSGTGSHYLVTGPPNGSYTITYNPVDGYIAPVSAGGSVSSTLLTFEASYIPDYKPIAEAKDRADTRTVALQSKRVSATFNGFFYVEEFDRRQAIRVNWPTPPAEGSLVNVIGTMATTNGERAIDAVMVQDL